jgi:hypothetical protein
MAGKNAGQRHLVQNHAMAADTGNPGRAVFQPMRPAFGLAARIVHRQRLVTDLPAAEAVLRLRARILQGKAHALHRWGLGLCGEKSRKVRRLGRKL